MQIDLSATDNLFVERIEMVKIQALEYLALQTGHTFT